MMGGSFVLGRDTSAISRPPYALLDAITTGG
jgi:hypothetical protein